MGVQSLSHRLPWKCQFFPVFLLFASLPFCPFLASVSFLPDPEQLPSASPGHHPAWHSLCQFLRHHGWFPVPPDRECQPPPRLPPAPPRSGRWQRPGAGAGASLEGSQACGELRDMPTPAPDVRCPPRELRAPLSGFTVTPSQPLLPGRRLTVGTPPLL